jgi:NADPH:quinone reductase-like Zn-dependent oxidoreductase
MYDIRSKHSGVKHNARRVQSENRESMRAVVHSRYGPAEDVLSVATVAKPVPGDSEVLVRVRAASMHADVWHVIEGVPRVLRLFGNGLFKPKITVPGTDLAGIVESAGRSVTRFRAGDEVFGESAKFGWANGGAYAEYAAVREDWLVHKPANVSFEQAAAAPTAGFIALNNLRSLKRPGMKLLINGAGGAMGTLAIQIAKAKGAHVTAVDRTEKLALMQALGADRVIDYSRENYLESGERYDFILDVVALRKRREYEHVLAPGGRYLPIGHADYGRATGRLGGRIVGSLPYFVSLLIRALLDPEQRREFRIRSKLELTTELQFLLESGKLSPVIGEMFSLDEVPAAVRRMMDATAIGRSIITP